jgi:hypothetical protein
MVGFKAAVGVTQGTLIVLRRSVGGGGGATQRRIEPGIIQTNRVVLPVSREQITVDVIYVEDDDAEVNAALEKYHSVYRRIYVYTEDEVQIVD